MASRPFCRYFANGCCRYGDRCPFSHEREARQDLTCRFYNRGYCVYGDNCRYDHSRQTRNNNSTRGNVAIRPGTANVPSSSESRSSQIEAMTDSMSRLTTRSNNRMPSVKELTSSSVKMSPDAPVFVPSWLKAAGHGELENITKQGSNENNNGMSYASAAGAAPLADKNEFSEELLCPYNETGSCPIGASCQFLHGEICDLCGTACLNPFDQDQQKEHRRQCIADHEKAMEDAFAEARTIEKQCGICMDNVWEKNGRFGILQNCRHCFCLECIRKWRQQQNFEHTTTRSCPECRTHSDFVIPATRWVEDETEKERLIGLYRENTSKKVCKYFKANDMDSCPFGNKCFYRHENGDGSIARCDSPGAISRRNRERTPRLSQYLDMLDDPDMWSIDDDDVEEVISEAEYVMAVYGLRLEIANRQLLMYRPHFNAKEQAAAVLDILRSTTDCDMATCKRAAGFVIRQLTETVNTTEDLSEVATALERDDVIDVENCSDSVNFDEYVRRLETKVSERDGPGRSAYDSIDDMYLCTLLESIIEILRKSDSTVVEFKFTTNFVFLDNIVRIYQISQNSILRSCVIKSFIEMSTVSDRVKPYLLSANFVSDVVLNTDLKRVDDAHTEKAIEFFGDVFDCEEEPSELLYDHMNANFIAELITYGDCNHVMRFLMNFVRPRTIEIIAEAFRRLDQIRAFFGRTVAEYVNKLSTSDDDRALKVFSVIYNARLSGKFFYANDLNVISGVVERIICDTGNKQMRFLALRVGARMLEIDGRFEYPQIINACQALLLRDDLSPDEIRLANGVCSRL